MLFKCLWEITEILGTLSFKNFQKVPNYLKDYSIHLYKIVLETSCVLVSKLNESDSRKNTAGINWEICYQKKHALPYCTLEPGSTDITVPTRPGL